MGKYKSMRGIKLSDLKFFSKKSVRIRYIQSEIHTSAPDWFAWGRAWMELHNFSKLIELSTYNLLRELSTRL